jgi:hypothetical protein
MEGVADQYVQDMGIFGDRNACTFPLRADQFVMVCSTCTASRGTNVPVVVCVGCSLNCHADHDQIEVGGKKNMQCECSSEMCVLFEGDKPAPGEEDVNVCEVSKGFVWCSNFFSVFFSPFIEKSPSTISKAGSVIVTSLSLSRIRQNLQL